MTELSNNKAIISFDVGIRNMAYCLFEIGTTQKRLQVLDWKVLNLMEKEEPIFYCNHPLQEKTLRTKNKAIIHNKGEPTDKKDPKIICGHIAKYKKGGGNNIHYYCEKHAKVQTEWLIPSLKTNIKTLKKINVENLNTIAVEKKIQGSPFRYKKDVLERVLEYYDTYSLEPIVKKQCKSAGETDLVLIGRNMKELLDKIPNIHLITHVIIENQISPIANRMKTVQGMLAQYFIMVGNKDIAIEFVSSANKLKQFQKMVIKPMVVKQKVENIVVIKDDVNKEISNFFIEKAENLVQKTEAAPITTKTMDKSIYKAHKKDGVLYTKLFLDKNECLSDWKQLVEGSKKADDLADCFLQGIWYLNSRNIINYAEDLKINSISLS